MRIYCDNIATTVNLTNHRAKDKTMLAIARAVWFEAATRDLTFQFIYIPGVDNGEADTLSRACINKTHMQAAEQLMVQKSYIKLSPPNDIHDISQFM